MQEKGVKWVKTLAPNYIEIYRKQKQQDTTPEDFELSLEGKIAPDNRWVILAKIIPWSQFEAEYAAIFSEGKGAPADISYPNKLCKEFPLLFILGG
ncbi:hypothetical protein C6N34_016540 [Cylindrospermopsis raciborskii Cr2010]|nr:hypothetical protein C6N34_016540 [Cylindrospermopsis raciborskii Cr2010]